MRPRDPIAAYVREARAQRRVGQGAVCACGEARPFALIAGQEPPRCFACERVARGKAPYELHHIFGRANSALTLRVPVNDHRAILSVAQYDWPPRTAENPAKCLLREAAARLSGRADVLQYMIDDARACAEALERECAASHDHGEATSADANAKPRKPKQRKGRHRG